MCVLCSTSLALLDAVSAYALKQMPDIEALNVLRTDATILMRQALTDARQSADACACDNMHVPRAVASRGIGCDARQRMQPMLRSAYAVNRSKTKSNRGSKKMPGIRHNRGIARVSRRRRACERFFSSCERFSSCCYAARA